MKVILFFIVLIGMMFMVEVIAWFVPGWVAAAIFFGVMFYGMFRLVALSIKSNQ